nr:MAG TPA: DNA packaging protein gp3 [Bacteriophage sp.]
MGRPRKISSPEEMENLWEEYKRYCDNIEVNQTQFSGKESTFVTAKVKKSISYTLEGFCVYIGIARSKFYQTYDNDPDYGDIVTRIREESENDVRKKFETGCIPSQLSGLWMSRYDGYNQKQQIDVNATITEADKELLERVSKRLGESK